MKLITNTQRLLLALVMLAMLALGTISFVQHLGAQTSTIGHPTQAASNQLPTCAPSGPGNYIYGTIGHYVP